MASIEMGAVGDPSKSTSTTVTQVEVQTSQQQTPDENFEPRFKRSVCCAYALHIFSAGILGHMYAGAWDVALHRALNFFYWAYNAPPGLVTSLILFVVDFFYLGESVTRLNTNPLDNTKTRCQTCLMMLPPVGCFGIHHAYLRNWVHFFLYSATGSGFGIAYIADCFRLAKYTEEANAALHGAPQMSILVRDTVRRYVMPTYLCLYRRFWLPQLPKSPFDETEREPLVSSGGDDHLGATAAPPPMPTATHGAVAGEGATARQAPLGSQEDPSLDEEQLVTRDLLVLSLCPCAHWSGLSACCAGAPRQGILHALTCSGFGLLFLIDLFTLPCRHRKLNAHKHMRRRALNVGVPAPREEIPCATAYGAWLSTGLCGGHQLILGNFWLFLGTLASFGGWGVLFLCDLFFLKKYLRIYNEGRAHENAFVATVERAKRWGSASMELHESVQDIERTRVITVTSASAEATIDAFNDLDNAKPISIFTAWVCWLPFGGLLGLHHLYLGRYAHFAVAAFTLNLFGVGWIADACLMEWYIKDAKYKYSKQVQAQPARVHTTRPGMESGLPAGPAGSGQGGSPRVAGEPSASYDTSAIVSNSEAGAEATTVMPPPVPGLHANAAATAAANGGKEAPAYSYSSAAKQAVSYPDPATVDTTKPSAASDAAHSGL